MNFQNIDGNAGHASDEDVPIYSSASHTLIRRRRLTQYIEKYWNIIENLMNIFQYIYQQATHSLGEGWPKGRQGGAQLNQHFWRDNSILQCSVKLQKHNTTLNFCKTIISRSVKLQKHNTTLNFCKTIISRTVKLQEHNTTLNFCKTIISRGVKLQKHNDTLNFCKTIISCSV